MRFSTLTVSFTTLILSSLSGCGSNSGGTTPSPVTIDSVTGLPRCPADPGAQTSEACVDEAGAVLCKAGSGFAGDELALCQPQSDSGMLFHYGPKDYDDPADVATFTLAAGDEDETCTFVHSPNDELAYVKDYHGRLRPHSHHLIVTTLDHEVPDDDLPVKCSPTDVVGARWLVGSQSPKMDVAIGGAGGFGQTAAQPGDPDYHLAQKIPAHVPMRLDLHYVNPTEEAVLKEAWISFDYAKASEVDNLVDMITFFQGDIDVKPHTQFDTKIAKCTAPSDRYVALLTGHFHKTGTRFSVWYEHTDGSQENVYETFDWSEPGNLYFRDGITFDAADPVRRTMGGDHPGYLHVKAGESLLFQCAFDNTTDREVKLGETSGDEMCNTFGMYYPSNGNVWSCACMGSQCF
ncbi:MAG TPA: hypothetical protein VHE30_24680 [Polyangiaceae bacterium]|nr:hypothetical protein [Polyangiaceae bacterium]